MPTKAQQDEINKAQLEILGESEETLEDVIAGIKQDLADKDTTKPAQDAQA